MPDFKYKAFLSYSHKDKAWANWLHNRLEEYKVPRSVEGASCGADRRVGRVFKDREELATSHSLSESIRKALAQSEHLVVVLSESSAASQWVNAEVRLFLESRSLEDLILVIPPYENPGNLPALEEIERREVEPLPADARIDADGQSRALRKVIAGLVDVDFDVLQQRDRIRKRQRNTVAAVIAVTIIAAGAYLAVQSERASDEAEAQRAQSAELANYLVLDLTARLNEYEEVGTLDAGLAQALEFFGPIDPVEMDDRTLVAYRTALIGIGSVRIRQGRPEDALADFQRAEEVSLEIVKRYEDDPGQWQEQAQATYYIGEAYWEMQDIPNAAIQIERSVGYAQRALELDPENFRFQMEVLYGLNNLGAVNTRLKNWQKAEDFSRQALDLSERLGQSETLDDNQRIQLVAQEVEAASWLAEITQTLGRFDEAFEFHELEISLRDQVIDATENPGQMARKVDALGYFARSLGSVGRYEEQAVALEEAISIARDLIEEDPGNVFWRIRMHTNQHLLAGALSRADRTDEIPALLDEAETGLTEIVANEGTPLATFELANVHTRRAYRAMNADRENAVVEVERALQLLDEAVSGDSPSPIAVLAFTNAVILRSALYVLDERAPDGSLLEKALEVLGETVPGSDATYDIANRAVMLTARGDQAAARPLVDYLQSINYRSDAYERMMGLFAAP